MKLTAALGLSLVVTLAACSDDHGGDGNGEVNCDNEPRADTYTAGMSKLGDNNIEFVLLESTPTPPAKGDNAWTVQILEAAAPMDGVIVEVVPFMPDHGHGTSKIAEVSDGDDSGTYEVTPVNLWMPGLWDVTISAKGDQGLIDSAVFSFCIDG